MVDFLKELTKKQEQVTHQLTPHQRDKAKEIFKLLETSDVVILEGSAGVGKTYLADYILTELRKTIGSFRDIVALAPTHDALSQIREKVSLSGVQFKTVAKELRLRPDKKSKKKKFIPMFKQDDPPFRNVGLALIDEASMIGSDNADWIEQYARMNRTKVIFVGDRKQLNPVNELNSPIFERGYPIVTLTEIIRQKEGNSIIELSNNLSLLDSPYTLENSFIKTDRGLQGYLVDTNRDTIIKKLAENNGSDDLRYLTYTNDDVDYINLETRKILFGDNPAKVYKNEVVSIKEAYNEEYYTNRRFRVEKVEKKIKTLTTFGATFQCEYFLLNEEIPVLANENLEVAFENYINALFRMAGQNPREFRYQDVHDAKDSFAKITYPHAMTVHKSQGSTFKRVAINLLDIKKVRIETERVRMLYTAVTRASDLVVLNP